MMFSGRLYFEYEITTDFHCCVFSLTLKKKLGVVPPNNLYSRMNARIQSLFEMAGYGARYTKDGDFSVLDEPINCTMGESPQFNMSELVNE